MVGTFNPIVYGSRQVGKWYPILSMYLLGQVASALLIGALFAGSGEFLHCLHPFGATSVFVALASVGAIATLQDLELLPFALPSRQWQVPKRGKRLPPIVMALCYGLGIGTGILTRIPFGSLYFVLVACFGSASISAGLCIMGIYGAARAMTMATVAAAQRPGPHSQQRMTALSRLKPLIGCLDGIALALAAGFVACQLLRTCE